MGFATGFGHIACGFPGLKKQFPLLRSGLWKVYAFGSHTAMIPQFADSSNCY
jgi:hypothetical protein